MECAGCCTALGPPYTARRVLRLIGWFVLVLVVLQVLRLVPGIGRIFDVPLLGFWLAAIVVAAVGAFGAERLARSRRLKSQIRSLGQTDTPHNRGKLGAVLLANGRAREALPHLEAAARGEPERLEWRYREAGARAALGDPRGAASVLRQVVAQDEDHAFGAALLKLAEAELASRDAAASLAAVERYERSRGTTPESAYRRGLALKAAGERDAAARAFDEVATSARHVAKAQRLAASGFAWRARLARWF